MKGHFTKLVKAGDRLREFNFRRLPGNPSEIFHVDVSDERGSRLMFKMHREEPDNWRIDEADRLPNWVYEAENKLSEAIQGAPH